MPSNWATIRVGRKMRAGKMYLVNGVACASNFIHYAACGEKVDAMVKVGVAHVIAPIAVGMCASRGRGRAPFPRLLGLDRVGRFRAPGRGQLLSGLGASPKGGRRKKSEGASERGTADAAQGVERSVDRRLHAKDRGAVRAQLTVLSGRDVLAARLRRLPV